MKLLFFTDCSSGVIGYHVDHVRAIKKAGVDVHAVVSSKELEHGLIASIAVDSIPILELEGLECHQHFWKHVRAVYKYVKENGIDNVHVQTNWQLIMVAIVRMCLLLHNHVSITYTIHAFRNNHPKKSFIARVVIGFLLFLFVDKVIYTCTFLKEKFSWLNYKMHCVPLGVSELFHDESLYLHQTGLYIIFPAAFRYGKNQEMILKAFAEFLQKTSDEKSFVILPGTGDRLDTVKQYAQSLGISDRVYFPGYCSCEVLCELERKCNIAVIPTNSETYGLCIVEPFVLGKCILTRNVGVASDIIKESENGFYFENHIDLAQKLIFLSRNMDLISQIAERNYMQKKQFSWDVIVRTKYLSIYNK